MTTATTNEYGHRFIVNTADEYLTKREAAELLGVCSRTIENYIRSGALKASKPSRKVLRIKRSNLDKMLDQFATT